MGISCRPLLASTCQQNVGEWACLHFKVWVSSACHLSSESVLCFITHTTVRTKPVTRSSFPAGRQWMSMRIFGNSNLTLKVCNELMYSAILHGKAWSAEKISEKKKKKEKNYYQTGIGMANFDERNSLHSFYHGNCRRGYTCTGTQKLSQARVGAYTCHSLLVSFAGIQNQAFTFQRYGSNTQIQY